MARLEIVRETPVRLAAEDGQELEAAVLVLEDGRARIRFDAIGLRSRELRLTDEQRLELREALAL